MFLSFAPSCTAASFGALSAPGAQQGRATRNGQHASQSLKWAHRRRVPAPKSETVSKWCTMVPKEREKAPK